MIYNDDLLEAAGKPGGPMYQTRKKVMSVKTKNVFVAIFLPVFQEQQGHRTLNLK